MWKLGQPDARLIQLDEKLVTAMDNFKAAKARKDVMMRTRGPDDLAMATYWAALDQVQVIAKELFDLKAKWVEESKGVR